MTTNDEKAVAELEVGDRFLLWRGPLGDDPGFYMPVTVAAVAETKHERAFQLTTDTGRTRHVTLGNQHKVRMT